MDRVSRILFSVLTEPQRGGQSFITSIKIAVLPIAKVFTLCFLGFLMASKYVNILPANGRKLLNGVSTFLYDKSCLRIISTDCSLFNPEIGISLMESSNIFLIDVMKLSISIFLNMDCNIIINSVLREMRHVCSP